MDIENLGTAPVNGNAAPQVTGGQAPLQTTAPANGNAVTTVAEGQLGQPVQQTQPQQVQTGDGNARKYAGMYDTVEQLEAAHKQLQTTYQGLKSQAKPLLDQFGTPAPQQTQPQVTQPVQPQIPQIDPTVLAKAWQENPVGTAQLMAQYAQRMQQPVQPQINTQAFQPQFNPYQAAQPQMQPQVNPMAAQVEYLIASQQYSDFKQLEPVMAQILQEQPYLKDVPNRFGILHDMAVARNSQQSMQQAVQNGISQGYEQAINKQNVTAQFDGGKAGQAANASNDPASDILAGILREAGNSFIL